MMKDLNVPPTRGIANKAAVLITTIRFSKQLIHSAFIGPPKILCTILIQPQASPAWGKENMHREIQRRKEAIPEDEVVLLLH